MDFTQLFQRLIKKREGQWGVLAAVLVIVVGVGIAVNPHTLSPQFTEVPECAGAQVEIYGGVYRDGQATLDIRNPGTTQLQLTVYALSSGEVETLPTTVYLTPGGKGDFSFALSTRPTAMEVHDQNCIEVVNLWKF